MNEKDIFSDNALFLLTELLIPSPDPEVVSSPDVSLPHCTYPLTSISSLFPLHCCNVTHQTTRWGQSLSTMGAQKRLKEEALPHNVCPLPALSFYCSLIPVCSDRVFGFIFPIDFFIGVVGGVPRGSVFYCIMNIYKIFDTGFF